MALRPRGLIVPVDELIGCHRHTPAKQTNWARGLPRADAGDEVDKQDGQRERNVGLSCKTATADVNVPMCAKSSSSTTKKKAPGTEQVYANVSK